MEINVRFLENLRLEAKFDDFAVTSDQPIRYKGDGTAPSPFDYFLASSALCAAYFVRVYCLAHKIPTEDIRLAQNNIVDPEDRYKQTFRIQVELPASISSEHRDGILKSIERCTVKKAVQRGPDFVIEAVESLGADASLLAGGGAGGARTMILGKDRPLEETVAAMSAVLAGLGIKIEIASWRNIVPNVWSVHVRDAASPMCFTNGKGATKDAALASALGEYIERIACNYFYNSHYLGEAAGAAAFVHYPEERWFKPGPRDALPKGLLDAHCLALYDADKELRASHLFDTNSGRPDRGICALPFTRQSDGATVYFPVSLVGNLFVSNGMSAGNTLAEAQVQCLSEIFERAVKKRIIAEELALPDVPPDVLARYPKIAAGIAALEAKGFPILVKDASLGGVYPVMCVTLMNPRTGGVFASFGAHPKFEVALERSLTELLQGRSFEGLNDVSLPTFNSLAVTEPDNFVEHFIDSTGVISWKFFSAEADFPFAPWDFAGGTEAERAYLFGLLAAEGKEAYAAVYDHFGSPACRILVPGFSEIYPVEDLIYDNTNKALALRADVLGVHALAADRLADLVERLEGEELDPYARVAELIGIVFDENTVWGQLNVGELKLLCHLALGNHAEAKEGVESFLAFNDNTAARRLFYQALDAVLAISLDEELTLAPFLPNLTRMFGADVMRDAVGAVTGDVRFPGLTPTSLALEGLDKHQKFVESYHKLHRARAKRL